MDANSKPDIFVLQIFPIVIYFSAVISIFYYWGLMQFIVCKIASLMQFTMGTTAIESLNAATNIFIGMVSTCGSYFIHAVPSVFQASNLHSVRPSLIPCIYHPC